MTILCNVLLGWSLRIAIFFSEKTSEQYTSPKDQTYLQWFIIDLIFGRLTDTTYFLHVLPSCEGKAQRMAFYTESSKDLERELKNNLAENI